MSGRAGCVWSPLTYVDGGGVVKTGRTGPRGASGYARSNVSDRVWVALDPLSSRPDLAVELRLVAKRHVQS
jgi:hypothetical protein